MAGERRNGLGGPRLAYALGDLIRLLSTLQDLSIPWLLRSLEMRRVDTDRPLI